MILDMIGSAKLAINKTRNKWSPYGYVIAHSLLECISAINGMIGGESFERRRS
jgi:hypothetical protein